MTQQQAELNKELEYMESQTPKVFAAINAVQGDLAGLGIAKNNRNQQQGFQFRGIDDVYNAVAPLLAKHKLVIMPQVLSREVTERVTAKGGVLFYVVVHVNYYFVSAEDGSKFVVSAFGEAMDSGDKATNKAMSSAYKYACLQSFCIPTEGDNDADATTHNVAPTPSLEQIAAKLANCQTMDELKQFWRSVPHNMKPQLENIKDQCKTNLTEQDQ